MKGIFLIGSLILMTGCCCNSAYRPVVTGIVTYKPVVVTPVVEPVMVYSFPVEPLNITSTTIDFY